MRHMPNKLRIRLTFSVVGLLLILLIFTLFKVQQTEVLSSKKIHSNSSPATSVEMKKARWEYFFRMLRDPDTNQIPSNIRQRELAYARILSKASQTLSLQAVTPNFNWNEVGPVDVGGRTRALAVDVTNSRTIIAGCVSGGIWKSLDEGTTWELKNDPTQNLSITSVAQDTRLGHTNTWYYVTGEFENNTASDQGNQARFLGSGFYKSTDNGETWNQLYTANNPTSFDHWLDYVYRIVDSPTTGSVFLACKSYGIIGSYDGGNSFYLLLGGTNDHYHEDVVVASNGTLIATLSKFGANDPPANAPGVYKSTDDGLTWTDITPTSFPSSHQRSVIASAPSNPDIVYIFTNTGEVDQDGNEDVRFHKINLTTGESEDRSANLPNFGGHGVIYTQDNYNMVVAVKPDDENFVLIGATSLFRSTDGFATAPQNKLNTWIGGYRTDGSNLGYFNHHCDQHVIAFDPSNPDIMWSGHDGGLSVTPDITDFIPSSSYSIQAYPILWEDKNNRYNTTQFYTVAIPDEANDNRIMGGTQDNGTPYFKWYSATTSSSIDLSTGDGGYCYFGDTFAYASAQNGRTYRFEYDLYGNPYAALSGRWKRFSEITPLDATDQLFINPFVVDPNNEDIMYYPTGNLLWRNSQLSVIPYFENGTSTGWTKLTDLAVPEGYIISALDVSRSNVNSVLYYGASNGNNPPKIYRLENAQTATSGSKEISITDAVGGAYVHNIAINPDNANEIIVALSNYNIIGLYHSIDGGQNYTAIEGNLEGDTNNPGPSLRSATILPTSQGTIYFVATSIGIFSTLQLNGSNTVWTQEGATNIGNVVCQHVTSRKSDGRVAVGTHGRGIFIGDINWVESTGSNESKRPTTSRIKNQTKK